MAILKPFRAWRPAPDKVSLVVSVPYDVVNTTEARNIANGNPLSFLRIVRPEIDFPDSVSIYSDEVYEQGKKTLDEFLNSEIFLQDAKEYLYLYQMEWEGKSKTGIFGCVSVEDYDANVILKHELTRPDKENDRTRHIVSQKAHAEPVMMTFRTNDEIRNLVAEELKKDSIYNYESEDHVTHCIWRVENTGEFTSSFKNIPSIYIADGHHRCASASRAAAAVGTNQHPDVKFFPAVLYPIEEVNVLAYNRVIHTISKTFFGALKNRFEIEETSKSIPLKKGDICIYYQSKWYMLSLPLSSKKEVSSQLDVARLQEFLLEPLLGITDQRLDENISFVGGIHGKEKLEQIVDSGEAELAISMFPTSMEELVAVSDAGLLMPPKSTWFEPKLKSGFLIHTF